MIQAGSFLKIIDTTGIVKVKCIKVLGNQEKVGKVGSVLRVSVRKYLTNEGLLQDTRKFARFSTGTKHLAMVIRTKFRIKRCLGFYFQFSDNAAILINKKKNALTTRLKGPILRELTQQKKQLLSLSKLII